MKKANKPTKPSTLAPPHLMSQELERTMRIFLDKRLKQGQSERQAMRAMRKQFTPAIKRELATNPEVQVRVKKHLNREALKSYRPWVRWIVRIAMAIRSLQPKKP